MLRPVILADYEQLSTRAADWLIGHVRQNPEALVCVAAGSTPARMYQLVSERSTVDTQLYRAIRLLKLDEWGGLARSDPATCEMQLRRLLVEPLGLSNRYIAFDSEARDPAAECRQIADWLRDNGPIDTCVLGLGLNGHLGFNEPGDFLLPHAHVAELSETSLAHSMVRKTTQRPGYGLTLGMADILQSRHVLALISGQAKQKPLQKLLSGQITTQFPASLLHLHPDVVLLCDAAAASADQ